MECEVAYETMTRAKEEVGIMLIEMGKGIECKAVHGHVNWGREERMLVKANPVDVIVIRHGLLNYSNNHPLTSPFIQTEQLSKYPYPKYQQNGPLETRKQM
jgi:hypothetical protein